MITHLWNWTSLKIDISGSTVTGIEKEYVYTGKAITPEVTVDGLTEGQDYEVAYSDNVNVGSAKVTLAGRQLHR